MELSNASHDTIKEIYYNLFNKQIDKKVLSKIKPNFYSPAELINVYLSTSMKVDAFEKRLLQNKKINKSTSE